MSINRVDLAGESVVQLVELEPLVREMLLKTSIVQLDEFIGGFRASQVALLESNCSYANTILHLLCIRAIDDFDEEVVWLDGGNVIDPYSIASMCKRLRLDKRNTLSRVNVSRAFTAHQLVTLVDEKLEEEIRKSAASTVIVSSIMNLFLDKDMKGIESYQLLRRCMENISRITKEYETVSIITSHSHEHVCPDQRMMKLLHHASDRVVQMHLRTGDVIFRILAEGRVLSFSPVPWNQMTLDEFRRCSDGENRPHISAGT